MTNRKVMRAVLHDVLHVPAFGQLGKTLTLNDPQFKYGRDLEMEWEVGSGLIWRLKGAWGLVPMASVFSVQFVPEDKPFTPSTTKSGAV